MSTKSTIFLTNENEHWYMEGNEIIADNPTKCAFVMEFDKSNVRVDLNDEDSIVLTITNPNCELYKILTNYHANEWHKNHD